jgi:hypothetical protein
VNAGEKTPTQLGPLERAKEDVGYYELKKHKPWFSEGCSKLLNQRKQAKLQWLQDPSKINGNDLNNIRHEIRKPGI